MLKDEELHEDNVRLAFSKRKVSSKGLVQNQAYSLRGVTHFSFCHGGQRQAVLEVVICQGLLPLRAQEGIWKPANGNIALIILETLSY